MDIDVILAEARREVNQTPVPKTLGLDPYRSAWMVDVSACLFGLFVLTLTLTATPRSTQIAASPWSMRMIAQLEEK